MHIKETLRTVELHLSRLPPEEERAIAAIRRHCRQYSQVQFSDPIETLRLSDALVRRFRKEGICTVGALSQAKVATLPSLSGASQGEANRAVKLAATKLRRTAHAAHDDNHCSVDRKPA